MKKIYPGNTGKVKAVAVSKIRACDVTFLLEDELDLGNKNDLNFKKVFSDVKIKHEAEV